MPYNQTMNKLTQVIGPRLRKVGRVPVPAPRMTASSLRYFNRGVSTYSRLAPTQGVPKPIGIQQYYNAGVLTAYGNLKEAKLQLGDLFNDIMGAIVPGWDQRPAALKQIVVKPDPTKLIQVANKIAPNAAGQIIGAANANGLNVMVQTPLGLMPMNQAIAQGLYSNAGIIAQAKTAVESVPMWVWLAGAGGILLLVTMRR